MGKKEEMDGVEAWTKNGSRKAGWFVQSQQKIGRAHV